MEQEIATVSAVKCFQRLSRLAREQTVCHVGYEIMSVDSNSRWHISSFPSSWLEQYNGYKALQLGDTVNISWIGFFIVAYFAMASVTRLMADDLIRHRKKAGVAISRYWCLLHKGGLRKIVENLSLDSRRSSEIRMRRFPNPVLVFRRHNNPLDCERCDYGGCNLVLNWWSSVSVSVCRAWKIIENASAQTKHIFAVPKQKIALFATT